MHEPHNHAAQHKLTSLPSLSTPRRHSSDVMLRPSCAIHPFMSTSPLATAPHLANCPPTKIGYYLANVISLRRNWPRPGLFSLDNCRPPFKHPQSAPFQVSGPT